MIFDLRTVPWPSKKEGAQATTASLLLTPTNFKRYLLFLELLDE